MSGTNIELFLFNIECFINQYLPYIDIVYDLKCRHHTMSCLPAERAAELEVEAGGQPVESCGLIIESQGHDRTKAHEKQSIIGMYLDLT